MFTLLILKAQTPFVEMIFAPSFTIFQFLA